jgi:hypothetical protein
VNWSEPAQPFNSWSSVYYPAVLAKKPAKAKTSTRTVTFVGPDVTQRIVPASINLFGHNFPGCIAVTFLATYSIHPSHLSVVGSSDCYDDN